jgi:hypothetical protein
MILYESFLHNYHNVKVNKKFLNKSNATPNSFSTSGLVVVYDKNDNIFTVDVDDEKYISGEYKILLGKTNIGKINVIDNNGCILKIPLNDERITSGVVTLHSRIINKDKTTVFHIPSNKYIRINKCDIDRKIHDFRHIKTKGMIVATDGKFQYYIQNTDERFLNGELWSINKGTFTAKTKNGEFIKISVDDERFRTGELTGYNKNKVLVKDKDGVAFMISKDDERYVNNEVQKIFGKYERTDWICPHCKKEGKGLSNANRWHFDNCKKIKY